MSNPSERTFRISECISVSQVSDDDCAVIDGPSGTRKEPYNKILKLSGDSEPNDSFGVLGSMYVQTDPSASSVWFKLPIGWRKL